LTASVTPAKISLGNNTDVMLHEQPLPPPVLASLRSRSAAFGARGGGGHAGRGAAAVGGWAQSARKI